LQARKSAWEDRAMETAVSAVRFNDVPFERQIALAYEHLERLRQLNGGYIASPYSGEAGYDRYDVYWLRDIMYATYANEYLGLYEKVKQSYGVVLSVFEKFHHKIIRGVRKRPDLQHAKGAVVHARVHPTTLEEITDEWGHHQLDIFGLFLFKTGDMMKQGFRVINSTEHVQVVKDILSYLWTARWDSEPDFGMWEEGPEMHSSSVGAVLAGLTMWHDHGYYDYKYRHKVDISALIPVSERFLEDGARALTRLLPRESESRPYDLAQLSLLWPYNILKDQFALQEEIIDNIEKHLVRERGVVRYPGDRYFSAKPDEPLGNEAQWPIGLAWLSIAYSKMLLQAVRVGASRATLERYAERARQHLSHLESVATPDGRIAELFTGGKPNHNLPLGWAQSVYVVAKLSLRDALAKLR
jgi:phosphorylase kinase alpha/beta subunit